VARAHWSIELNSGFRWSLGSGPLHVALLLSLTASHVAIAAYSAARLSPTMQEPALVVAGLCHWNWGRYDVYSVNPPPVKMVAAIPSLVFGYKSDWRYLNVPAASRPEFRLGSDFVGANSDRALDLVTFGRFCCIPFSLVGLFCAYFWSRQLYGGAGALLTFSLYAFEPTMLAHAGLVSCDTACQSFGIVAAYTFWRWNRDSSWRAAIVAGFALGAALLSKLTWIILLPLWPALWVAYRLGCRQEGLSSEDGVVRRSKRIQASQLGLILLIAMYTINVGYGFSGAFRPLGEPEFVSCLLGGSDDNGPGNRFRQTIFAKLPIPLPSAFLAGYDLQQRDFETYEHPSYLRGEWRNGGWWYYYAYGMVVKLPLGVWALFAWYAILRLTGRLKPAMSGADLFIAVPALALFVLVSCQTEFNHHLRYTYPTVAFGLILVGNLGVLFHSEKPRLSQLAIPALVVFTLSESLCRVPNHISFFNEVVGGPAHGWRHLGGSSLDWGQDIRLLRDWVRKSHRDVSVVAVFDAPYDPQAIGFNVVPLSPTNWSHLMEDKSRPLLVVSRCFLQIGGNPSLSVGHRSDLNEWRLRRDELLSNLSELPSPSSCYSVWRRDE
jgi:hypothetical protein